MGEFLSAKESPAFRYTFKRRYSSGFGFSSWRTVLVAMLVAAKPIQRFLWFRFGSYTIL